MNKVLTAGFLWLALGLASSAFCFEDQPFELEAVVPESSLLVVRGVEYREFRLTYTPGECQLYINGAPIFGLGLNEGPEECAKKYSRVRSAQLKIRNGVPCEEIGRWYHSQKNEILWAGARMIQDNQSKHSDLGLTMKLLQLCNESPIAEDILGAFVVNGMGYVKFATLRWGGSGLERVYLDDDWDSVGTNYLPFGETALRFSKQLIKEVTSVDGVPRLIALGPGGGGMHGAGEGMVSRGVAQLAEIKKLGHYVKGPIPQRTFR